MTVPQSIATRTVFVDTSALYASINRRDSNHAAAARTLEMLSAAVRGVVTSNLIVAETHGLILRRLGRDKAADWLTRTAYVSVVLQNEDDDDTARDIIARYDDKQFSYTDAVSFAIMDRLGISTAFAFDDDFRQYGLDVIP